jgi:class 3 adenylate cyclase
MKASFIEYKVEDSAARMNEILKTGDVSYEEVDSIPSRERLTFTNGFYVKCTALFVDIRKSSDLPTKHTPPKLARLYRAYLSETVALINGNIDCAEVNIVGDSVSGIFDTPFQVDVNHVFRTAYYLASLNNIMNYKFAKNGISEITIGIGIAYGRALMIKAGYSGSGINDVVWMGDVVNEASNLCKYANQTWTDREIMVSNDIYSNLTDTNKGLLHHNGLRGCYHGNVVSIDMEKWQGENCT